MTELEKILKPLMEIADDETFCTQEYEAIKDYIEEKDFINVTTEDWQEIAARGYDVGWMIECYVPYLPKEKKLNMARQIWDELADIPTIDAEYDLLIDANFRCWNKGSTVIEIWQDIEHWFGVSVATDLMNNMWKRGNKMTREKETTIYFADGREVNIYRYKPNEYCIEFSDTGSREYGSYLEIVKMIEDYEAKLTDANKKDNEENHPMTSVGTYINFWNTYGNYDVFVILNEAETVEHFETIMDNNVEDICHSIMQNNNLSIEGKKRAIETIFDKFTDYGVQIFINPIEKGSD